MNPNAELIRLYSKQLKTPTFADYTEVLRRADPSTDFAELLLELMKLDMNGDSYRLRSALQGSP